jgi:hypothetical protein
MDSSICGGPSRKSGVPFTSFPEIVEAYAQRKQSTLDSLFAALWGFAIRTKSALRAQPAPASSLAPRCRGTLTGNTI